jgi:hypothetical protein
VIVFVERGIICWSSLGQSFEPLARHSLMLVEALIPGLDPGSFATPTPAIIYHKYITVNMMQFTSRDPCERFGELNSVISTIERVKK